MSVSNVGSAGTQIRRSAYNARPAPSPRHEVHFGAMPFFGAIEAESVPVVKREKPERRRSDIGRQEYGSGTPQFAPHVVDTQTGLVTRRGGVQTVAETPNGPIRLTEVTERHGFVPSASAIDFLRSGVQGSVFLPPPERFYR